MTKRSASRLIMTLCLAMLVVDGSYALAQSKKSASPLKNQTARVAPAKTRRDNRPDIVIAVKGAAAKDCGCGACAAKGCEPCHGKNCYFCAAKALVAMECGCGMCNAKGCEICGPGCDVCKFHLAPVAEAKARTQEQKK
jgi:hypothetical protein